MEGLKSKGEEGKIRMDKIMIIKLRWLENDERGDG